MKIGTTDFAYASMQLAIQARLPVIVWGDPGIGKTLNIEAFAKAMGWDLETQICSSWDQTDVGLPFLSPEGDYFSRVPPAWAKRLTESCDAKGTGGMLFLDEISCTLPAVQGPMLRVLQQRIVGDYALHPLMPIVAAANPSDVAAGGFELAAPMANRLMHLDWHLDPDAWIDGMLRGWPAPEICKLPSGWRGLVNGKRATLAAFIRVRRELLMKMPKNEEDAGRAWPSPRTWDMAATALAAAESAGRRDCRLPMLAGLVGEGAALEYVGWENEMDIPTGAECLADPKGVEIPTRGDKLNAMLTGMVGEALQRNKAKAWNDAWVVLGRVAESSGPDVGAVCARTLMQPGSVPRGADVTSSNIAAYLPLFKDLKAALAEASA